MLLGLQLEQLCKVLRCASLNDTITLQAQDSADKLNITLQSKADDRISNFVVRLIDIDADVFTIPSKTYNCVVKMPSNEFQRIIRELSGLSDTVGIEINQDGITFSSDSHQSSGMIQLKPSSLEDGQKVQIKAEKSIKQFFAVRYLLSVAKGCTISDSVVLMIATDIPLVCEYKVENLGNLRFYVAPKIEED